MTSSPSHGIFSWISGQNWPWFFSTHLAVTHPECWKTLRATPNNLSISMCEVMPLCCCSCCLGMPCRATVIETLGFGRYVEPVAQLRPSTKWVHGHCGHRGHCGHYLSDAQTAKQLCDQASGMYSYDFRCIVTWLMRCKGCKGIRRCFCYIELWLWCWPSQDL